MADRPGPTVPNVAEELRRVIAGRRLRRRRLALAVLILGAAVPLAASIRWTPPVVFVWNPSPSAPVGLYRLHRQGSFRRGDMVVAWTPGPARALAAQRHYLPLNVPLVKRVAAAGGDRVCASDRAISINGRPAAVRQQSDSAGRPMAWWKGCRHLRSHEYFLLMQNPLSFDGRYFGVTRSGDILGRAELLWGKPAKGAGHG